MKQIRQLLCTAALAATIAACNSPASSQDRAVEAQREADQARTEAIREAEEKAAAAEAKANAVANEARDEAKRTVEDTQAQANEAASEATTEFIKARNDLRERSRTRLEKLDRSIASARTTASKKSTQVQANFDEVMRDVDAQRVAIQQELATLDTRAADGWDRFKSGFEAQVDAIEVRLKDAQARL